MIVKSIVLILVVTCWAWLSMFLLNTQNDFIFLLGVISIIGGVVYAVTYGTRKIENLTKNKSDKI